MQAARAFNPSGCVEGLAALSACRMPGERLVRGRGIPNAWFGLSRVLGSSVWVLRGLPDVLGDAGGVSEAAQDDQEVSGVLRSQPARCRCASPGGLRRSWRHAVGAIGSSCPSGHLTRRRHRGAPDALGRIASGGANFLTLLSALPGIAGCPRNPIEMGCG